MAKTRLGATCAAALLSLTFVAQTASAQRSKANRGSHRDSTPSATVHATQVPQIATLTGCVVRDAANGGKATIKSNGFAYKLTAKNDQDFSPYLGKKVEVTGALTTGEGHGRATSGKSDELGVPKDGTAVGGQSDVPVTGAARDNIATDSEVSSTPNNQLPLASDKGTTADLTGRIHVKTIKTVAGSCL